MNKSTPKSHRRGGSLARTGSAMDYLADVLEPEVRPHRIATRRKISGGNTSICMTGTTPTSSPGTSGIWAVYIHRPRRYTAIYSMVMPITSPVVNITP
jgi:hypothetical protein